MFKTIWFSEPFFFSQPFFFFCFVLCVGNDPLSTSLTHHCRHIVGRADISPWIAGKGMCSGAASIVHHPDSITARINHHGRAHRVFATSLYTESPRRTGRLCLFSCTVSLIEHLCMLFERVKSIVCHRPLSLAQSVPLFWCQVRRRASTEGYWTLDSALNTRKRGSLLLCLCDMRGSKFQRCFVPVSLYPAHSGRTTHHDLATRSTLSPSCHPKRISRLLSPSLSSSSSSLSRPAARLD